MHPCLAGVQGWAGHRAKMLLDYCLPFSQQINNISKTACCYLHSFPCVKPSPLPLPDLGLEEVTTPLSKTCFLFVGQPPSFLGQAKCIHRTLSNLPAPAALWLTRAGCFWPLVNPFTITLNCLSEIASSSLAVLISDTASQTTCAFTDFN